MTRRLPTPEPVAVGGAGRSAGAQGLGAQDEAEHDHERHEAGANHLRPSAPRGPQPEDDDPDDGDAAAGHVAGGGEEQDDGKPERPPSFGSGDERGGHGHATAHEGAEHDRLEGEAHGPTLDERDQPGPVGRGGLDERDERVEDEAEDERAGDQAHGFGPRRRPTAQQPR